MKDNKTIIDLIYQAVTNVIENMSNTYRYLC